MTWIYLVLAAAAAFFFAPNLFGGLFGGS